MCMPMMGEHVATPSVLAKVILLVGQLVLYLMSNLTDQSLFHKMLY